MKNVGMAGAVALVGIGLTTLGLNESANDANADSSVGSTTRLPRQHDGRNSRSRESACLMRPVEHWFEFPGEALCAINFNFLVSVEQGDIDGDGVADRFTQTNRQWNGSWEEERDTGAFSYHRDGESVKLAFTPVAIDWNSVLGDPNGQIVTIIVSKLADIDGDGRRDLIIARQDQAGQTFSWHRNIIQSDPLIADINRDGFVNGEDMGLLLGSWTG